MPDTTGWSNILDIHTETYALIPDPEVSPPSRLWLPEVQSTPAGVQTNRFGFTINWASGMTVAVDASTSLVNPIWVALATNTLSTGGTAYFSDPQWTNYPARFYRLRQP